MKFFFFNDPFLKKKVCDLLSNGFATEFPRHIPQCKFGGSSRPFPPLQSTFPSPSPLHKYPVHALLPCHPAQRHDRTSFLRSLKQPKKTSPGRSKQKSVPTTCVSTWISTSDLGTRRGKPHRAKQQRGGGGRISVHFLSFFTSVEPTPEVLCQKIAVTKTKKIGHSHEFYRQEKTIHSDLLQLCSRLLKILEAPAEESKFCAYGQIRTPTKKT